MDPLELIRSVVITAAASGTVIPLECRDSVCLVGGQEIPAATPTRFARTAKSKSLTTVLHHLPCFVFFFELCSLCLLAGVMLRLA
jgi:hypothetical protein